MPFKKTAVWLRNLISERTFILLTILIFSFVLILAIALLGMNSGFAKRKAAVKLAHIISDHVGYAVDISGLSGTLPFHIKIDACDVSDEKGKWLSLKDITLDWTWQDMAAGHLRIENIEVNSCRLHRLPSKKKAATTSQFATDSIKVLNLKGLPNFLLDRFTINEFFFEKAVFGNSGRFRFFGKAFVLNAGNHLNAELKVKRLDQGRDTQAELAVKLDSESRAINIKVDFAEDTDGFVATALGVKGLGPVSIACRLNGPPDWVEGNVEINAKNLAGSDLHVGLDLMGSGRLNAKGAVIVNPENIPNSILHFVGNEFNIQSGMQFSSKALVFEDMRISTPGMNTQLSARIDLNRGRIDSQIELDLDSGNAKLKKQSEEMSCQLVMKGNIFGPLNMPNVKLKLNLEQLSMPAVRLSGLTSQIDIRPVRISGGNPLNFKIAVDGASDRLFIPNAQYLSEKEMVFKADLNVRSTGEIAIHRFEMLGLKNALTFFNGRINPLMHKCALEAHLNFSEFPVRDFFSGAKGASIDTAMNIKIDTADWRNEIDGQMTGQVGITGPLTGHISFLDGQYYELKSRFKMEGGERLQFFDTYLTNEVLQLQAESVYHVDNGLFQSTLQGTIPNLKRLVQNNTQLPPFAVKFDTEVRGTLAELSGNLYAEVQYEGRSFVADINGGISKDTLNFNHIDIRSGANIVNGSLSLDMAREQVSGKVDADLKNLGELAFFGGASLDGSAVLACQLSSRPSGQFIDCKLNGEHLVIPGFHLGTLSLNAAVENAFKDPKGYLDIAFGNANGDGIELNHANLNLKGSQSQLAFRASADSPLFNKSELSVGGEGIFLEGRQNIVLTDIHGTLGALAIKLLKPVRIDFNQMFHISDTLQISFGNGLMVARGGMVDRKAALDIDFKDIDLDFLNGLGGPEIEGLGKGNIQVKGDPLDPVVKLSILAQEIHFLNPNLTDFAAAELRVRAHLEKGRLKTELGLFGLYDRPSIAELSVPVKFSIWPLAFEINPREPIEGLVDVEFEMEMISNVLFGEDQIAAGKALGRVKIDGTLGNPLFEGALKIEKGQYEYLEYGTFLRDIHIEAVIEQSKLRLIKAEASDGEKGTIAISGWMDLLINKKFPIFLEARLNDLLVVRQDDFTCPGSGSLKLSGPLNRLLLEGDLTTGPVEFILEDSAMTSLTELEIVEINKSGDTITIPPKATSVNGQLDYEMRLALDINLPSQVYIRGLGIDSEWKGRLKVNGTTSEPTILGSLTFIRGNYQLIVKTFKLTHGVISFYGNDRPAPLLDITAEAENENIKAVLVISGNAESPTIELSSTPAMPTDEIVSQLFFKKNAQSISPTQAIQLAAALHALSGNKNKNLDIFGQTRKLLQLDQLELRESQEGLKNTTVGFGKYLIPGIYLDVEESIGGELGKVTVEMELTPHISIEGETGPKSKSGVGLNYKYNY